MREVTVYYSYDDREFFDRDECLRYEWQAIEEIMSVNDCYEFFDKNHKRYIAPDATCEDAEEWMNWLVHTAERCTYVKVNHILPESTARFVENEFGDCITPEDFNNETGLFKYDYLKDEWVKVGE